ncbi:hypothetical protein MHU86_4670 [Fragilaria crotonensis]|nr:hypothetical protein MHU86_4670 [Fragilaria crotonensis]
MPSEIGRLLDLETLDLRTTKWSGPLPSEIGLCTKVTMLDLWDTDLTGTVPSEIGNVKSLESLTLGSALLAGPLPTEIGRLSRLTTLSLFVLSTTDLIAIPSEVALLSNMRFFYLEGVATPTNTWLADAMVSMTGLTSLSVANNANLFGQESGILPTQIGRLTALESINFFNAGLTGTLPTELARLTKLTYLAFWSNILSGTIPTVLGLLTDLIVLDLSDNLMLTGFVPSEVGSLTKLSVVDFAITSLSQQIPPEVCALGLEVTMSKDDKGQYANAQEIDACK